MLTLVATKTVSLSGPAWLQPTPTELTLDHTVLASRLHACATFFQFPTSLTPSHSAAGFFHYVLSPGTCFTSVSYPQAPSSLQLLLSSPFLVIRRILAQTLLHQGKLLRPTL